MAGTFIGDPWKLPYTAQQIQDVITNGVPVVGDNGNWWRWDINTSAWVDTGVTAATSLADDSVITSKLADGSVTTPKLAPGSVTWPKLAPEVQLDHRNLLDNAYFIGGGSQQGGGQFPVNQRRQTEYTTAGYTIDRWGSFRNGTISLTADGIAITPRASGNMFFYQIMENPSQLEGKTITLSALLKGEVGLTGNLWLSKQPNQTELKRLNYECTGDWQLVSLTFDVPQGSGFYAVGTMVYANTIQTPVTYAAMKLELGPNQTLAYESAGGWQLNNLPNFSDELMRCQRCQVPWDIEGGAPRVRAVMIGTNYIQFTIPISSALRATPSLVYDGNLMVATTSNSPVSGFSYNVFGHGPGWVGITAHKVGHGLNDAQLLYTRSDTQSPLFFDSNQ